MRLSRKLLGLPLLAAAVSAPALADHNSKWGEGWANMPNDVHNTRIDTRGDDEAFRDFVKYGNGAESENRFDTDAVRGQRRPEERGQQRPSGRQGGASRR